MAPRITFADKNTGDQHFASDVNEVKDKCNNPGKAIAFTQSIPADDEYYFPDYTQTGALNFTKDASVLNNQGRGNGVKGKIKANGDSIEFSNDFDVITKDAIIAGRKYLLTCEWDGTIFNGSLNIVQIEGDTTAPIVTSMSVEDSDRQSVIVNFDEIVTATNVGYTFKINSTPETLTGISGTGTTALTFTFATEVSFGDILTMSYDSGTGDTLNSALIELESFTDQAVTNNVQAYTFANTYEMLVDSVGEGINVLNPDCYPSDGVGNDEDVTYIIWGTTPSTLTAPTSLFRLIDDDDDFILSDIGLATGKLTTTFRTDGSNIMNKQATTPDFLTASTRYQIAITKTGETYAGVKIYVNGSEISAYTDASTGTYTGIRALVGNLVVELPRLNLASGFETYEIYQQFNAELSAAEILANYNSGTPIGLTPALQTKCVQENLLNNNANADNIGINGTNQGGVTYQLI